ncbi:Folate-binding protein YgfZ OS=Tsukamurella paurometabola (strain ATCC 8368 / DSM / CCUG 35730/ CIP 100753 / JCM 10117 / KCTC 9821 / NBRC 16120 / NCIMB 702349 / NCTC 13040) OX=521096 GN=Tpau_3572 PE=4 SV=1 [Tsukamurella paurometabola]|uniref:Folate-binding protein YgfZ n=1 Tax=Tsukamurella paurometabola (strain ATCC 8368 / DSM 20162 / CCUG 35730 / CIP 100753 / JCM 10117 / KCTC 9821 / NBRC 16120 / NCIMB 702349 / NCTC 13040) TaxID=521096 RepID=D5UXR3_TSUPD|nr:folate-binding protein YgfZ [Tsukamurella paurometabola]ADG80150.1 folate-binding protein YgfZ [Tsukamurella paurometabola DSM 20162]SUP38611.1 Aminomethyltransferase [Tsukamurella paurometabola]
MVDSEHVVSGIANPEDAVDAGVTWHYGDPFGEQRAAERGAAVVDRSNRRVITLTGPDRLSWLHSITSQHLTALPDGGSVQNLNLDGSGRVLDHFWVTDSDGTAYLDTEPATLAPKEAPLSPDLGTYLQRMVFRADVQVQARDDLAVLTVFGPDAATVAEAVPGVRRSEPDEVNLIIERAAVPDAITTLVAAGARPVGTWAYEARRVAAAHARAGLDTDDKTIPHEVNWIGTAVHLDKGCYRGQETIARVHNIGRPPRRLVLLHLDGSADATPATGDPVTVDGRTVGRLGTVVEHADYGPIALALIKRTIPDDAKLEAGGAAAAIDADVTPAADTAEQAGRSAVDRLRGR